MAPPSDSFWDPKTGQGGPGKKIFLKIRSRVSQIFQKMGFFSDLAGSGILGKSQIFPDFSRFFPNFSGNLKISDLKMKIFGSKNLKLFFNNFKNIFYKFIFFHFTKFIFLFIFIKFYKKFFRNFLNFKNFIPQ